MPLANYIVTANPFALAAPPQWFLQALHAYDPLLVIFPSVKEPLYRMGRRGRYGHGLLRALRNVPDSTLFVEHRVWPWKSILPQELGADWNRILTEIPNYDTQRFGNDPGAALDEAEARVELANEQTLSDTLDAMNSDTYATMQLMNGSRVGAGVRAEGVGYKKLGKTPSKKFYQSGSTRPSRHLRPRVEGAGAMFVGR
jgi:hypothetical protein